MDSKQTPNRALALEPADGPTLGGDAAGSAGNIAAGKADRDLQFTTTDEFLASAVREYQAGNVDQALWRRATAQCGDNTSLVIAAYLRHRATALQLQSRAAARAEIQARGTGKRRLATKVESATNDDTAAAAPPKLASTMFVGTRTRERKFAAWHVAAAVAGLLAGVVLVYVLVSPSDSEPARQQAKPPVPVAASQPAPQPSPRSAQPAGVAGSGNDAPPLSTTTAELKRAGNWQLFVLYATEWTRQEPGNATAWTELAFGYAKLQQYNDALDAAGKAVALSPGDVLAWRTLAQVNLTVDRLNEARVAFDKVLALKPDDADAVCGATQVAQKLARPKEPETSTRRVKPADGSCPDSSAAAFAPAAKK
jgi:tetratricopeptide (TPR) repeat protein